MSCIKDIQVRGFSIPFQKEVETTWSSRKGTTSFLIEIKTEKGVTGYGEMVAFFPVELCKIALGRIAEDIKGRDITQTHAMSRRSLYGSGWMRTGRMNDLGAAAWASFEMALVDAQAKEAEVNVVDLFGGRLNQKLPVAVNIPVGNYDDMASFAQKAVKKGNTYLFTKAAKHNQSLEEDLTMLEIIQKKVGNQISLHVDVNGAWTLSTALEGISEIRKRNINISCLEQPVMEAAGLKTLRQRTDIAIGVNELLSSPQAVIQSFKEEIADVYILDMYEVGGLRNFWYLAQFLADANVAVVCRAHGGSSLSYIAALQIMAASHGSPGPHQFYDNDNERDLIDWNWQLSDGKILLPEGYGIGIDPIEENIEEFVGRFNAGEIYSIYANKQADTVPNFPKY